MTCGLVQASYRLPEWQAVETDFLCTLGQMEEHITENLSGRLTMRRGG